MTLVTGGESPRHSKWHFITGTVMLLAAFVVDVVPPAVEGWGGGLSR